MTPLQLFSVEQDIEIVLQTPMRSSPSPALTDRPRAYVNAIAPGCGGRARRAFPINSASSTSRLKSLRALRLYLRQSRLIETSVGGELACVLAQRSRTWLCVFHHQLSKAYLSQAAFESGRLLGGRVIVLAASCTRFLLRTERAF